LLYLEQMAVREEDPEARCNEVGKELEARRVNITSCPLQHLLDRPRN
jgi:hypothetical protein